MPKPLPVGVATKDPGARRGHVMGGWADGYKLHAWMTEDRRIPLWCVTPLNGAEQPAARPSTHPVTLRQMGPQRRELLRVWRARPELVRMVHRHRIAAEATFSNLCSYGGGLGPLPAWVRRLPRVRRWVGAKIILYHARFRARARARAKAKAAA